MARSLLTLSRRIQHLTPSTPTKLLQTSVRMASNLNSNTISEITAKEKELTGSDLPVRGGPTAQAQKHAGQTISSSTVSDITQGERKITGEDAPVQGGPAATAQSHLAEGRTDNGFYISITDSDHRILTTTRPSTPAS